ncbi:MAG: lamin tail domain-containing protein [Chloroflexi bacterium]|nr:lamin tail domain-containing protein [Chloroflexota bacterium]
MNSKPSWWAFWAYPLDPDDINRIYLPVIEKDGNSSSNYTVGSNIPSLSSPETTGDVQITYAYYAGNDPNEPNEFIEVKNNDTHSVQLHNWTLTNVEDETFSFPYLVLQPGQVCRIYTNEYHTQWCGFTFEQGNEVWSNEGDTITLNNEAGQAIDTCSYQYQAGVDGVSCPNFIIQPPDPGNCGCPVGEICPQVNICSADD